MFLPSQSFPDLRPNGLPDPVLFYISMLSVSLLRIMADEMKWHRIQLTEQLAGRHCELCFLRDSGSLKAVGAIDVQLLSPYGITFSTKIVTKQWFSQMSMCGKTKHLRRVRDHVVSIDVFSCKRLSFPVQYRSQIVDHDTSRNVQTAPVEC